MSTATAQVFIDYAFVDAGVRSVDWQRHPALTVVEQQQLLQFEHPQRRQQFAAVRVLLRQRLRTSFTAAAAASELVTTAAGKPYLQQCPQLHISLSHSHDAVACAVSVLGPVGLDIEQVNRSRPWQALAKRICANEEYAVLQSLPATEAAAYFFKYWTLKEAVRKTAAEYFRCAPRQLKFQCAAADEMALDQQVLIDLGLQPVQLQLHELPEVNYLLAAALQIDHLLPASEWQWSLLPLV